MKTINPDLLATPALQALLQGAIAPRPIALVSTLSAHGQPNLSPFSFFNLFSARPPVLIFSPARRIRDNTTKHTLENILQTRECVVNVVPFRLVEQVSLASTEYAREENEFVKSGLTPIPSSVVAPARVAESPVQMECRVIEVKELGSEGGAGNLVLAQIAVIHLDENILDEKGVINPYKIDLVARMGADWYCRANGQAVFSVEKPIAKKGIGIDQLPESIRTSPVLTGNDLARLANIEAIPTAEELAGVKLSVPLRKGLDAHWDIARLLRSGQLLAAWKLALVQ